MAALLETLAKDLTDALASHALATGYFDAVNKHEPKNAPGRGLTGAVWLDVLRPYPGGSGLNVTTATVVMNVRLYMTMVQEPQDQIDETMLKALGALLSAYGNNFTLNGLIRNVDIAGSTGFSLEADAGYLTVDQTKFRVVTISVPCIVNDVFNQTP